MNNFKSVKKYTKKELFEMDAVEVYKLVLQGKISRFPAGFWMQPEAKQNAGKCVRFLIEEVLKLSEEDVKEKLDGKLFKEHKLNGMICICFNGSPIKAIDTAYPGKFNSWEFKIKPNGYWDDINNCIKATKWLIEEKLKLSDEELKEQLSIELFAGNGLESMFKLCFNSSPYKAINAAYPDKFKPWEFNTTPNGFWNDIDNGIQATKWLIEEKLKLSDNELKEKLSVELFVDNGLGSMLHLCFDNSPYKAINTVYPNKFKPWEFNNVSIGYWKDINNAIKATRWLIEEKLKLSEEELKEQLSTKLFVDNGLKGMIEICFNSSPYDAINAAYPEKFKPWELKVTSLNYWLEEENRINAIRWLIEEKLKLSDEELKEQLCSKLFIDEGLGSLLKVYFDSSSFKAINALYPNKFKPWEFKITPAGYWDDINNSIKAIKWLIEEKLKLSDEELKEKLSKKLFYENGLGGMLSLSFNSSPYKAINTVYPGKFKKEDFKNYR